VIEEQIRDVLVEHGRLATDARKIDEGTDLYQAGLTSHASVNVMLALEDAFDVEFPDDLLRKETFESIAAIRAALHQLVGVAADGA
jgi:acyl carrier protein